MSKLREQLNKERRENKYKNKGDQKFDEEFNYYFYIFLNQRYNITEDDIQELEEKVSRVKSIDDDITVSIIDKFYSNINSSLDFLNKCKNFYSHKTYVYVGNDRSKKITNDHFLKNYH